MAARKKTLIDVALDLPFDERIKMARELLESVENEANEVAETEKAWGREISVRARNAISGKTKGIDSSVVFARARKRLRATR